jgi:N-methylhydantoinase A
MWRVGVDSGGTFTDVCLVDAASGDIRVWKVPSTPDDPSRAIAHGVVEGLREAAEATPGEVEYFGHGTTVATNALIQHRGAETGLITTEGFRDLLEIGRQRRPHLYDLQADKPPVLIPRARRHEVRERLRHDGRIDTPLDLAQVREAASRLGIPALLVFAGSWFTRNMQHRTANGLVPWTETIGASHTAIIEVRAEPIRAS